MQRGERILRGIGVGRSEGLQESEVDLVALGALMQMVPDLGKACGRVLVADLEVHVLGQPVEEFRAQDLGILGRKDGADELIKIFVLHKRHPHVM